jgi:hypothetical protein
MIGLRWSCALDNGKACSSNGQVKILPVVSYSQPKSGSLRPCFESFSLGRDEKLLPVVHSGPQSFAHLCCVWPPCSKGRIEKYPPV